jgi:rare lipoprotein A
MNPSALTAAHRSLPFGTKVLVENLSNGRSVKVTINDRGPFVKGRIIDLSKAAAQSIGMGGVAKVRISTLGRGGGHIGGTSGGLIKEASYVKHDASSHSSRRQVASASRANRAIASRPYRVRIGSAFASVANNYGIFTDTPGFMKTAEVRHGSGTRRGYQRVAFNG